VLLCKMYERGGAGIEDLREAGVPEGRIKELVEGEEKEGIAPPSPE
jgi:hypothetical protein